MTTSPDEEARFLSEVDVLEALTQEELDDLAPSLPDRRLDASEYLYRPRDRADGLFALKWGRVRIYKTDNRGREFTLEVLGEGTIFGELALGPGRLRPTYAQAVEPSWSPRSPPRCAGRTWRNRSGETPRWGSG
jgi:CRP-like cAMP-binding protein